MARKRKRKSKSTQTPPDSNMAAPIPNVNISSPELSQVIANANESIYGVRSTNPTMFHPSIQQQQHSTPISNFSTTPMFNMTQHLPGPSVPNLPIHNSLQVPQPTHQQPISTCDSSTLQTILETINFMNTRLNKLDKLDELIARVSAMESHFTKINCEIKDIRHDLKQQSDRLTNEEFHYNLVENRVSGLETERDKLVFENGMLQEKLLEMQAHSMKYNLIFNGIEESRDPENENAEEVVKNFIHTELGIDNAQNIEFCNVHRLRQRVDRKPRNIIAKFAKYSDHERVRSAAIDKLKGRRGVAVFQQYPTEISNRRKELIPKMIELKQQGNRNVRLVLDKLYVGNQLVNNPLNEQAFPMDNQRPSTSRQSTIPPPTQVSREPPPQFFGQPGNQRGDFCIPPPAGGS